VTSATAPVLDKADSLISAADDIISSVPQLPATPALPGIPSLPLPPVPVPSVQVPSLPIPSVPVPSRPVPSVPAPSPPAPELPVAPVPGVTPTTPVPHAGGNAPDLAAPPQAASHSAGGPRTTAVTSGDNARPATLVETAVQVLPATVAGLPLAGTGLSLAELQMTTPQVRELAGARPAAHRQHPGARPGYAYLQSLAVSEGTSGNASTGSEGSGAQAAEVAGDWDRTPLFAGVRVSGAAQHLPSSPAADPGSSPD
jgi:hypothetical protein